MSISPEITRRTHTFHAHTTFEVDGIELPACQLEKPGIYLVDCRAQGSKAVRTDISAKLQASARTSTPPGFVVLVGVEELATHLEQQERF